MRSMVSTSTILSFCRFFLLLLVLSHSVSPARSPKLGQVLDLLHPRSIAGEVTETYAVSLFSAPVAHLLHHPTKRETDHQHRQRNEKEFIVWMRGADEVVIDQCSDALGRRIKK